MEEKVKKLRERYCLTESEERERERQIDGGKMRFSAITKTKCNETNFQKTK